MWALLQVLSVFFSGTALATTVVACFIHEASTKTFLDMCEPEEQVTVDEYTTFYSNFGSSDALQSESPVISNKLVEKTPLGIVYMSFDAKENTFRYFADTKELPYAVLETVARRYVTLFKCPQVYVCMETELKQQGAIAKEVEKRRHEEENKRKKENTSRGIFASFKKYKSHQTNYQNYQVKETINRFKYHGKLVDFFGEKQKKEHNDFVKIDFSTFKQQCT